MSDEQEYIQEAADDWQLDNLCLACSGTGEGQHDGALCHACKGSGNYCTERDYDAPEFDMPRLRGPGHD